MKLRILLVSLLALPLMALSLTADAREEGIAAVVNEEAVTYSDLRDRMKLIMVSSGLPRNEEMRQRLQPQILATLIEESIKSQEAERQGVTVTEADIDAGFAELSGQNGMKPEQFKMVLLKNGIPESTLREQIRAQIAWTRLVQNRLRSEVSVSQNDVEARMSQLERNIGKQEYLLAEIFLPVDQTRSESEVKSLASRLVTEMKEGKAAFPAVAQQFSQSAGAMKGGDLGWVVVDDMPEEIASFIANMKEGAISQPIRTPLGYHIVTVRKSRQITEENIPPREVMMNRIGMERLDRLQQRYLLDLKSESFIESRV